MFALVPGAAAPQQQATGQQAEAEAGQRSGGHAGCQARTADGLAGRGDRHHARQHQVSRVLGGAFPQGPVKGRPVRLDLGFQRAQPDGAWIGGFLHGLGAARQRVFGGLRRCQLGARRLDRAPHLLVEPATGLAQLLLCLQHQRMPGTQRLPVAGLDTRQLGDLRPHPVEHRRARSVGVGVAPGRRRCQPLRHVQPVARVGGRGPGLHELGARIAGKARLGAGRGQLCLGLQQAGLQRLQAQRLALGGLPDRFRAGLGPVGGGGLDHAIGQRRGPVGVGGGDRDVNGIIPWRCRHRHQAGEGARRRGRTGFAGRRPGETQHSGQRIEP